MSLLLALIIGVVAGTWGAKLIRAGSDVAMFNLLAGVIGSVIGLVIYAAVAGAGDGSLFNPVAMLMSLLCAMACVFGFAGIQRLAVKKTDKKVREKDEDS